MDRIQRQGPKEFVGGRDDVLDLRARARFEDGQGGDQHALVGDQVSGLLQLGEGCSCGDRGPEHVACFDVGARWEAGECVVRQLRTPDGGVVVVRVWWPRHAPPCVDRIDMSRERVDESATSSTGGWPS